MTFRRAVLGGLVFAAAGCGGGRPSPSQPAALPPGPTYSVVSVTDGDTIRITPALLGATSVRFVNIDTPESRGDTQEPWAFEAKANLQGLIPPGTSVAVITDRVALDTYGRVLGRVVRAGDGRDVNREQLRGGFAVLYVIWPNEASFEDYRLAQIEAQDAGRGIWNPARPLRELPFLYRERTDHRPPERPVGDFRTRLYVQPADYDAVHVNNRVFFPGSTDAASAGYRPCPRDASGAYSGACFSSGR